MNPRYRRLLIPGLLVVLVAIVLITSLAREAEGLAPVRAAGDAEVVCTIGDPRVTESSGLALSRRADLAYTVNDSGNDSEVYAISLATGKVVGTTSFGESFDDAEALALDETGTLWIADTGDNLRRRDAVTLYAIDEPLTGDRQADAKAYRLTFPDGAQDVETLLINPGTDTKYLVSKGLASGKVYVVPDGLSTDRDNRMKTVGNVAGVITDGAFTPDGGHALLRDYGTVRAYDAKTWKQTSIAELPEQKQGETLAVEADGESILVGSEGKNSELVRVGFSVGNAPATPAPSTETAAVEDEEPSNNFTALLGLGAAALLIAAAIALLVRFRR